MGAPAERGGGAVGAAGPAASWHRGLSDLLRIMVKAELGRRTAALKMEGEASPGWGNRLNRACVFLRRPSALLFLFTVLSLSAVAINLFYNSVVLGCPGAAFRLLPAIAVQDAGEQLGFSSQLSALAVANYTAVLSPEETAEG